MASIFAENALKEFQVTVDDLAASLEFSQASSKLRPRLRDFLDWGAMGNEAKALVNNYLKQRTAEASSFYRGSVVVLAGAFEQLVRRLVQDAVADMNKSIKDYDNLTDSIKNQNIFRTGQALSTVFEPLDHLELDYYSLSRNLGTCVPASQDYTLNVEAFGIFISNVSPEHLLKAFERLGIELTWDDFGRDSALQAFFDKRNTRDTSKEIEAFLKDFIKKRNKLAHTGGGP